MADEERAAKAARAKALLKSHQQKKKKVIPGATGSNLSQLVGSSQGPPSVASASASVLFSPPGSEAPIPDDRSEFDSHPPPSRSTLNHVSYSPVSVSSPLSPPPRHVATPPTNSFKSPPPPSPPTVDVAALQTQIQSGEQTIAFLVEEKTKLTSALEGMQATEQRAQLTESLLANSQSEITILESQISSLRSELSNLAPLRDLPSRLHEVERELELAKRTKDDLKVQLNQQRQKVRQLEDQISQDDRVENMERSMRGVQERAESLEFQLSKSKQAHAKLKAERDEFEKQASVHNAAKAEWEDTREKLSGDLQAAILAMDDTNSQHNSLKTQYSSLQKDLSTLREQLNESQAQTAQLASIRTQLHSAQAELKRKEGVEGTVKNLQGENVELMQSLNEVRDKVVQLSGEKMDLAERVEGVERALRNREDTITNLELALEAAEVAKAETTALKGNHGKEVQRLETLLVEHQQAYASLQGEMEELTKGVQALNGDRSNLRHAVAQLEADLETARGDAANLESETTTLRLELNDRAKGGDEISGMLNSLREEVEGLRTELTLKNEELIRAEANARSPMPGLNNLGDEMHALELSTAQSRVRTLETSLFQEQAKTHTLQRRITGLEDEVHMMKMQLAQPQRLLSPRPPSATPHHPKESKRPIPKRLPIDSSLPADVKHNRKISLSMLKARIDSELSLRTPLTAAANGHTPKMGMGKLAEEDEEERAHSGTRGHRPQPQFGDELHVFCCASCQGDLVVL